MAIASTPCQANATASDFTVRPPTACAPHPDTLVQHPVTASADATRASKRADVAGGDTFPTPKRAKMEPPVTTDAAAADGVTDAASGHASRCVGGDLFDGFDCLEAHAFSELLSVAALAGAPSFDARSGLLPPAAPAPTGPPSHGPPEPTPSGANAGPASWLSSLPSLPSLPSFGPASFFALGSLGLVTDSDPAVGKPVQGPVCESQPHNLTVQGLVDPTFLSPPLHQPPVQGPGGLLSLDFPFSNFEFERGTNPAAEIPVHGFGVDPSPLQPFLDTALEPDLQALEETNPLVGYHHYHASVTAPVTAPAQVVDTLAQSKQEARTHQAPSLTHHASTITTAGPATAFPTAGALKRGGGRRGQALGGGDGGGGGGCCGGDGGYDGARGTAAFVPAIPATVSRASIPVVVPCTSYGGGGGNTNGNTNGNTSNTDGNTSNTGNIFQLRLHRYSTGAGSAYGPTAIAAPTLTSSSAAAAAAAAMGAEAKDAAADQQQQQQQEGVKQDGLHDGQKQAEREQQQHQQQQKKRQHEELLQSQNDALTQKDGQQEVQEGRQRAVRQCGDGHAGPSPTVAPSCGDAPQQGALRTVALSCGSGPPEESVADGSCVVCWSEPAVMGAVHGNTVHRCLCGRCCERLGPTSQCPLCKQDVERFLRVFG